MLRDSKIRLIILFFIYFDSSYLEHHLLRDTYTKDTIPALHRIRYRKAIDLLVDVLFELYGWHLLFIRWIWFVECLLFSAKDLLVTY